MPAVLSKQAGALGVLALLAPLVLGQKSGTLDTLKWLPCDNNAALCGDIYFCALDASTYWEYWNTPINPMTPAITWGSKWPVPFTKPPYPEPVPQDYTYEFEDPNGSNGFLYGFRTGREMACRPGKAPIIRVEPGRKYKLTLHNSADMNDPVAFPLVWSQMNALQVDSIMANLENMPYYPTHTTNLHIHGLHQSGMGDFDNVLKTVLPGQKLTYTYIIPDNHPGGMHWYHPHFHGKVVFQVFGGAYGPFIIEDSKKLLKDPPSRKDCSELDSNVINFLTDQANERVLVAFSGFQLWMGNGIPGGATIQLNKNVWHRVRVLFVFPEGLVKWTQFMGDLINPPSGTPLCEIRELGWDGVYASSVPWTGAPVDSLNPYKYAVHGAERVDFAIRCSAVGSFKLKYVDLTTANGIVATFKVTTGSGSSSSPFLKGKPWTPYRPPWTADLQGTLDVLKKRLPEVQQIGEPANAAYGGTDTFELTVSMDGLNGVRYMDMTAPTAEMKFGVAIVQQIKFWGTGAHPTHMHQQHYQIIGGNCGPAMKIGQIYDTVSNFNPDDDVVDNYEPTSDTYDKEKDGCIVRFRNIDYSGIQVIHCHVLDHEDIGIVGYFKVPAGPGAFELTSEYTEKSNPLPDCTTPRTDGKGNVVCRHSGQCGSTKGYDTCNRPCVPNNAPCSGNRICVKNTCVSPTLKEAMCEMGQPGEMASSGSSVPGYTWAIVGVSLAVAAASVLGAVWFVRRSSNATKYDTIMVEDMKVAANGWKSPYQGHVSPCPSSSAAAHPDESI